VGAGGTGQASICGGKWLLRTLIAALPGGGWRQGGRARAGWRGRPRATPSSRTGEWRRWWLPGDALVELEGRSGWERQIDAGVVLGAGLLASRRAAGGRDPRWCRRLAKVDEDVVDGRRVGDESDDAHVGAAEWTQVKKIPKQVFSRCEWGHDDYSLHVENLPKAPPAPGQQALELE